MIALYLASITATTVMPTAPKVDRQPPCSVGHEILDQDPLESPPTSNRELGKARQGDVDPVNQAAAPPAAVQTQPNLVLRGQLPESPPEESKSRFGVTGAASVFSDYTLRGVSLNERKPAVQGSGELSYRLPFGVVLYAGFIATSANKNVAIGSLEMDPYAAIGFTTGAAVWKLTSYRIVYPASRLPMDFNEQTASVTVPVGPIGVTLFYLHDRYRGGGHSNWGFVQTAYAIPRSRVSVRGSVGYEDGDTWNEKINWSLGAFYNLKPLTLGFQYVDTNKTRNPIFGDGKVAGARTVFSATASF